MPTPDIFQQVTASAGGEYLWSNPLNWTEGTPTDGDSVVVGALGFDDLASLSLAGLTLNAGGRVAVTGASLDVTTVTVAAGGAEVLADAADAGAPVTVTLGTVDGSAGYMVANGADARLLDQSAVDQGETYYVGAGGFVELTAAPSSASILAYISSPGTFALADPAASNAVEIGNIGQGDAFEVPGDAVSNVDFGANSLTVATNTGTYAFSDVDYGAPITSYTATPDATTGLEEITFIAADIFQQITAAADGEYLWSNTANWSKGVPTDGDSVAVSALGFDDVASLSLANLILDAGGRVAVTGGSLDVTTVTVAAGGAEVLADAADAGAPVTVTLGTVDGSGSYIDANGAGARLIDQAAADQGETYYVGGGGFVEVTAAPSSASILAYISAPGTFALADPAASNAVEIGNIGQGDALEVPGDTVSNVDFGADSLTVVTNTGTYAFTDVDYGVPIASYTATPDTTTGLEEITFIAADIFQQTTAAADGAYLWSNPLNWTKGVPTDGDGVAVAALGSDDLASLSLASLILDAGGRVAVTAASLDVTTVTVAAGGTEVLADAADAGAPVVVTLGTVNGSAGYMVANGADARLLDQSAVDQGETYYVGAGGFVELAAAPSSTSILAYISTPGTFALADPAASNAVEIGNIAPGDALEVPGGAVNKVDFGADSLTVITNAGTYAFTDVEYGAPVAGYSAAPDTTTGLEEVTFALCFCEGALIRTPAGDVPVEQLRVGDSVTTWDGEDRPIVWIGVGLVLATRGRRNAAAPVIVCRGALTDNVPHADLRVTKGHAFLLDGVLIPVEFLVNHRSILWDDRAGAVSVYHVELATHAVLVANGAPAESYRDDGNRWLFQNADSVRGSEQQAPCAPVLTGGPIVDRVWQRLLDRSGPWRPPALTDDPDVHLMVGGHRLDAARKYGATEVFRLPPGVPLRDVRIVSRAAAPDELGLARDPRVLGVAMQSVTVLAGSRHRTIGAGDGRLCDGFHAYEPDLDIRWTDGEAVLPDALFDGVDGPAELLLQLNGATRYPATADGALMVA
jgi:hypothetical protein